MRRLASSAAVVLSLWSVPAFAAARTVVVFARGTEAGRIQQKLEAAFGARPIPPAMLDPRAAPKPSADQKKAVFEQVAAKFNDGEFEDAMSDLTSIGDDAEPRDRALRYLWSAAIGFKKDSSEGAALVQIRNALSLWPSIQPPPEFPKSVVDLVERGRKADTVRLTFDVFPAESVVVNLDGVDLDPAAVKRGVNVIASDAKHVIRASSPGWKLQPIEWTLRTAQTQLVYLEPATNVATQNVLEAFGRDAEHPNLADLARLAALAGADEIVVAVARDDQTAVIAWAAKATADTTPLKTKLVAGAPIARLDEIVAKAQASHGELAKAMSIGTAVASTPSPTPSSTPVLVAMATPRPRATPASESRTAPPVHLNARAGLAWLGQYRTPAGGTADAPPAPKIKLGTIADGGAGPELSATVERGRITGSLDLVFAENVGTTLSAQQSNGKKTLSGGSTLDVAARAGYQFLQRDRFFAGAWVGAEYMQHSLVKLAPPTPSDPDRQFLPGYTQIAAQVWLEGGARFGGKTLVGGVSVEPGGTYTENPTGATGTGGTPGVGFGARVGLEIPVGQNGHNGSIVAGGRLFSRSLTFTGESTAWNHSDLQVDILGAVGGVSYSYRFGGS